MILYLDSSVIVKTYIFEPGSAEVRVAVAQASAIGTSVLSRAEVVAAFHKAVRMAVVDEADARHAVRDFIKDWRYLVRTRITERLVEHAGELAWNHGLRGYDAVHLASAAALQQAIGREITLATFDLKLWQAGRKIRLAVFPDDLPAWRAKAKSTS